MNIAYLFAAASWAVMLAALVAWRRAVARARIAETAERRLQATLNDMLRTMERNNREVLAAAGYGVMGGTPPGGCVQLLVPRLESRERMDHCRSTVHTLTMARLRWADGRIWRERESTLEVSAEIDRELFAHAADMKTATAMVRHQLLRMGAEIGQAIVEEMIKNRRLVP
jgi:hypothetical protein